MNNLKKSCFDSNAGSATKIVDCITEEFFKSVRVTRVHCKEAKGGSASTLYSLLFEYPGYSDLYQKIEAVRNEPDEQRAVELKKSMPCFYPSGIFYGSHTIDDWRQFSGFIAMDFDWKDNHKEPDEVKQTLAKFPFVAVAMRSIRNGAVAFIPLPGDAFDEVRFKCYFRALADTFARNGLVVDSSCSNPNRARFMSFDAHPYYNPNAEVWTKCANEDKAVSVGTIPGTAATVEDEKTFTYNRVVRLVEKCEREQIDPFPTAKDWFICGRALAAEFGERGRDLFLRLSAVWSNVTGKTHREDPNEKYTFCLNYPGNSVGVGCFFARCARAGVFAKGR